MKTYLHNQAGTVVTKTAKGSLFFATCLTLLSMGAMAQPTLQSSNVHTGISLDLSPINNVDTANLITAGANVTWDLSAATLGTTAGSVDFLPMDSTGYASQYPTANIAMRFNIAGQASYYNLDNLTSNVLEEVAINVGTGGLQTFIDNRTDLPFPFTYGQNDTDSYQKAGQGTNISVHIYDAYGTLIVGTDTFTNLVRVKNYDSGTGDTQYIWWQTSPVVPVFDAGSNGFILWKAAQTNTGIKEVNASTNFRLYPNPAQNQLTVLNDKPLTKVEVYDLLGKLQLVATTNVIDIASLSKGLYFVRAYYANSVATSKFTKL